MGKIDGARRRALIRLRMKEDPEFFARRLFPDYCRLPFSPMHRAIFRWHGRMGEGRVPSRRGLRFALAAPRGSAKSTLVSLILPLHDLLFRREKYMVLLSATERQAAQRLRAVRRELTRFPSRHCRLTARVLEYGKARMEAHGAGTELRGISHGSWRPTKIILDDAETSRCATSGRARLRLRDWFAEIVEYLGDSYTHLLAIGTILHTNRACWRNSCGGRTFRACAPAVSSRTRTPQACGPSGSNCSAIRRTTGAVSPPGISSSRTGRQWSTAARSSGRKRRTTRS